MMMMMMIDDDDDWLIDDDDAPCICLDFLSECNRPIRQIKTYILRLVLY